MGTWIEIRCEVRTTEVEGHGLDIGQRCLSADNAGPMGMADDSRTAQLQVIQELESDARDSGWVKRRSGWVCPFCVRHPATPVDD
jgi:hypothetical protein